MPTNDERREVAARLRKCIRFAKECDQNNEGEMIRENGNVMFRDIAEAVGGDYANFIDSYEETLTKLADLIEPEPERTCHAEMDWDAMEDGISGYRIWRCSCGEQFLHFRGRKPQFCPECGAKVVGE